LAGSALRALRSPVTVTATVVDVPIEDVGTACPQTQRALVIKKTTMATGMNRMISPPLLAAHPAGFNAWRRYWFRWDTFRSNHLLC
jgi:hypothetical protein